MNIIIVGCGKVGQALAEQLSVEGNNITVIDNVAAKVMALSNRCDVLGVVGNGATHLVQEDAGIKKADLLIAVTGSDELNLICCLIAKVSNGRVQTIARVRNPEFSSEAPYLKDAMSLAMVINPEAAAAAEIARVLSFPSAIKIDTFAKGKVELLKFKLPEDSRIVNCSVKDVISKLKSDVLFCTVERGDEVFIANGDFVFEGRDVISIVASPKNATDFFKKIGYKMNSVKDVMIVGGGEITEYLIERLLRVGIPIKVIEKNKEKCDELSNSWSGITVINGDAIDKNLLLEERLADAGAFVTLTNMDEENIILSLFAKNVGKAKLVTKINRIDFDDIIMKNLELDTVIYPKNITSDIIARYVRAMKNSMGSNVEALSAVIKGKVEAAEFNIKENSPVSGIPLSKLRLKDGVLIAAIIRNGKPIIPRGNDEIRARDTVLIVSNILALHDITDILK